MGDPRGAESTEGGSRGTAGCRRGETGSFGFLSNPLIVLRKYRSLNGRLMEVRDDFGCLRVVRRGRKTVSRLLLSLPILNKV